MLIIDTEVVQIISLNIVESTNPWDANSEGLSERASSPNHIIGVLTLKASESYQKIPFWKKIA
jgi:hypothetical protein